MGFQVAESLVETNWHLDWEAGGLKGPLFQQQGLRLHWRGWGGGAHTLTWIDKPQKRVRLSTRVRTWPTGLGGIE